MSHQPHPAPRRLLRAAPPAQQPALALTLGAALLLALSACTPAPPTITEASLPRASQDAEGPYRVTARVEGAVDAVRLVWTRRAPEGVPAPVAGSDALNAQGMISATFDGEVWTALLAGGFPVADYGLRLVASNSAGESGYPSEGEARFEVRALTGSCAADSECLEGEVCHRAEGYCFSPPSPCAADAHCPRDTYCSRDTGLCRFYDSACASDADCAAGYACDEGACRQPCGGACALGYLCDGFSCVAPPCDAAADCPPELPVCEEGRCAPLPNQCDPACRAGESCVQRQCVPGPCGSQASCAEGLLCLHDACSPCTADGQCGEGRHCDLSAGAEAARCRDGRRGRLCAPCQEAVEGELGCGVDLVCSYNTPGCRPACSDTSDCDPFGYGNTYCDNGACITNYNSCAGYECYDDDFCDFGELCEVGYCREAQRCEADADCAADRRCRGGLCALRDACAPSYGDRCGGGDLCVGGVCEPPAGGFWFTCSACNSDLDCGAQEVCSSYANSYPSCVRLCDDDSHCGGDEYCDHLSEYESICVPVYWCEGEGEFECGDDYYEPNNAQYESTVIDVEYLYLEGSICFSDEDWYQLSAPLSAAVDVSVFSDSAVGFEIYDNRNILIDSIQAFGGEQVSRLPAGTWQIRVYGYDNYTSFYAIYPTAQTCYPDPYEPNDRPGEASFISSNGVSVFANLCEDDTDWYTLETRAGQSVDVILNRYYSNGDELILTLSDPSDQTSPVTASTWDWEVQRSWFPQVSGGLYITVSCPSCAYYDYELTVVRR